MPRLMKIKTAAISLPLFFPAMAHSQTQATAQQRTEEVANATQSQGRNPIALDAVDRLRANIWGLTDEEMLRAKTLLEGPRKAFSVENLSPIEALGIHATSEAERRKYAEMFARAFHADVERSLAWNRAFTEAMARLYPNEPVVNFSQIPPVPATVGAADTLNVPRTAIIETPAPGYTPLTQSVPAQGSAK
ncbi:MAG: hypothetical protein AB7E06_05845 [Alcaligenes sp.]